MNAFDRGRSTAVPAPRYVAELLDEADGLIALMARESLPSVARHARTLHRLATDAGAREIASAAHDLESIPMGKDVSLVPAMRHLTEAIAKARHDYHLDD
jgi:hypothetical protein